VKVSDVMQRNVTKVAEDDNLGLALQLMLWNDIRHLPVVRPADGRVTGILSETDMLRARSTGGAEVLDRKIREFMQSPVDHIHPNADVADAAADLSTKKMGCLPVLDAGELVGIVSVGDLLGTIAVYPTDRRPAAPSSGATAADIMHADPLVVHADDPLLSAAAKMVAAGVRHMVVVDAEQRVIGIVSDRDVRSAVGDPVLAVSDEAPSERLAALQVQSVMTPDPRMVDQAEPVRTVLDALLTDRFGALPVTGEGDKLVGIVSYIDVLKHLADRVQ
jgi:acetoin utilization protein AcuB